MIELTGICDNPKIGAARKLLAADIYLRIPVGRYALMSDDPALTRPAIDILSGIRPPASGRVTVRGLCSWPIGRAGFIRGKVNGYEIVALVSRLYNLSHTLCTEFVREMMTEPSALGDKIEHWPSAVRHEFSHAIALLPPFDIYAIEGTFPFFQNRFTRLWKDLFERRTSGRTLILATTRVNEIRTHCDRAIVCRRGGIEIEDDLESAIAKYPLRLANISPTESDKDIIEERDENEDIF